MFPDIMIRNRMSLHSDKAYGTSAKKTFMSVNIRRDR